MVGTILALFTKMVGNICNLETCNTNHLQGFNHHIITGTSALSRPVVGPKAPGVNRQRKGLVVKVEAHKWRCNFHMRYIWVFPKIGVPQNGRFIMENPIKMDDLGVPQFSETFI